MTLSPQEIKRYSRQMILPELGQEGQLRLKAAKVLLVGAGGLGSPSAIYLAAAGIGTLGIIDADKVEISNLHRQVVHFNEDLGKLKVTSAQEKINRINPQVQVIPYATRLNAQNALAMIKDYDLVIDGTDNFPARYLINDACVLSGKPFIFGGVLRFEGQCSVFGLTKGPCYRCIFAQPPSANEIPSCAEAGVLGILPGIIGLLQSNEATKLICGIGEPLAGRLLIFDALATSFREVKIKKDPHCPICGPNRTINEITEYQPTCTHPPQPTEDSMTYEGIPEITVQELKQKLDQPSPKFILIDVREPQEWDIVHLDTAILKPLSTFEQNYQDIPTNKPVYIHCKVGGRSRMAVEFLQTKGYTNCFNVKGGIDAWVAEIDQSLPTY
jgi:adenylyltransferase/sulfurtransferase